MTTLTYDEILRLQKQHQRAIFGGCDSLKIRKGWSVANPFAEGGFRYLTDDEVEIITGERPKAEVRLTRLTMCLKFYRDTYWDAAFAAFNCANPDPVSEGVRAVLKACGLEPKE